MKVILLEKIERLGKPGDVVTVKEGFARNYLIPKNKAKPATLGNMKILDALKKKEALEAKKILDEANALAGKVSNLSITITVEAGEEEKLFGSVSNADIAASLAAEGVTVDKKDVLLEEPIKKLGVYQVSIRLHPEVKTNLKIWVVKSAST